MKQHSIHTEMIKQVAERLGPLRPKVAFLGGSATGFHITDKAEPEIRATKDFIIKSLQGFLVDELFLEALPGHLLPDQASQGRRSIILERIKEIVEPGSN
jgi:hypothetical protein